MLSLHTNNAALSAQNSITRTQSSLSTSMTRLSTGYRINSSADDAAGLQIASRLKAQTSGMAVAMRNTQNATSMLQTADGALDEVSNMLVRMKDLATQAADASSTADDKAAMQSEYDALGKELNNVLKNTSFGGNKLLVGDFASTTSGGTTTTTGTKGTISQAMTFQIGASSSETMNVDLSGGMTNIDNAMKLVASTYTNPAQTTAGAELTTPAVAADPTANPPVAAAPSGASTAIDNLTDALAKVNTVRSGLGAAENRLSHVYNNLSNVSTNTKAATGLITDVDFATESSNMTSSQMLLQAGTAMLKQTNSMSSMVMSLLQ